MESNPDNEKEKKTSVRILTNSEADVSYWLKLPTEDFIQLLVHDIRHELQYFHTIVDMVSSDNASDTVLLDSFKNEYTLRDVCQLLLQCETKIENAVNVASEYGKYLRSKDAI